MAQLDKKYFNVCQYHWELTGIGCREMTILSKMIKFRGVPSFRVGLKYQITSSTLLLMTANLNKMGLKAGAVSFSYGDFEEQQMTPFVTTDDGNETGLQLFTAPLHFLTVQDRRFVNFNFQIYLSSIVETYRLQEVDVLLRNQLASSKNGAATDFEIIAEGKRFPVHKYMLAARSPVFAAKFREERNEGGAATTEKIHLIDAASVEQFIMFLYTGQLDGSQLNREHLMKLALSYQIKTLWDLCQAASHTIDVDQMVLFGMKLKPAAAQNFFAMAIKPDTDSEIDSSTSVNFIVTWNLDNPTKTRRIPSYETSDAFVYQQKKLFRAQLQVKNILSTPNPEHPLYRTEIKIVLLSYNQENVNYKVEEVTCFVSDGYNINPWIRPSKMQERPTSDENKLQIFAVVHAHSHTTPFYGGSWNSVISSISFKVKLASTVPSYGLTFADSTWTENLWAAAVDKVLTDVEFYIADESISAHRSLLCARSPVFAAMFASDMKEARTGQVLIDDVDPVSFRYFLHFIYTGTLVASADKAKIFAVADKYQVETLMDLCRSSTQPLDIDELSEAFLTC